MDMKFKSKRRSLEANLASKGTPFCFINEGEIIKEYSTIAAAVAESGVSSKSIRDAANGIQKHAGGYCWKYKD